MSSVRKLQLTKSMENQFDWNYWVDLMIWPFEMNFSKTDYFISRSSGIKYSIDVHFSGKCEQITP